MAHIPTIKPDYPRGLVDNAIKNIIDIIQDNYKFIHQKIQNNLIIDPECYINHHLKYKTRLPLAHYENLNVNYLSDNTDFYIPISTNENQRFFIWSTLYLNKLQLDSPLHQLIKFIWDQFEINLTTVEIRFEKGYMFSYGESWHYDGASSTSFSTCFSNVPEWITRIVDPVVYNNRKEFVFLSYEEQEKLAESLSEKCLFGCVYDVYNILHRAPRTTDLSQEIDPNDYRLFLRFQ